MKPKKRQTKTADTFSSAEFLELQRDWYQKARDSGFEDIEAEDGSLTDEDESEQAKKTIRRTPGRAEALAEYYTEAERGLASLVFESPTDRAVWVHHARGASEREIAELLQVTYKKVRHAVKKYRKRLGITRPR